MVHAEALGDDPGELVGGQAAVGDQHLAGAAAALARLGDRALDRAALGEAELDDHVADELGGAARAALVGALGQAGELAGGRDSW